MNNIRIGTVFILHRHYSNPNFIDYNPKERFFVYLGKSSIIDDEEVIAVIATTTTQTQHYGSYGDRTNNPHVFFKAGEFGFTKNCILDLNIIDYNMRYNDLINSNDVEILGNVSINKLKEIYNHIYKSNKIPIKIKFYIYDSFNNEGITGLSRPRKYKNRGRN